MLVIGIDQIKQQLLIDKRVALGLQVVGQY